MTEARSEDWIRDVVSSLLDTLVNVSIQGICKAESIDQAIGIFLENRDVLQGWRFILNLPGGNRPDNAVSKSFSDAAAVLSFFDRAFVIDEHTINDMAHNVPFGIDYSITFDTQAVSYLNRIDGATVGGSPDFQAAIRHLLETNANCDPLPYVQENFLKMADGQDLEDIFRTMRAYNVFKNIDSDVYKQNGEIVVKRSADDLTRDTQIALSELLCGAGPGPVESGITRMHAYFYCLLLAMTKIQFSNGNNVNKPLLFAQFMDEKLNTMFHREMAVANELFTKGQKSPFFGKVQKRRDELLTDLRNMAWDLLHIRYCEGSFANKPREGARYFFPALLSFDRGLIEIVHAYPLRSCAIAPNGYVYPFYDGDVTDFLGASSAEEKQKFGSQFFSIEATARRRNDRDEVDIDGLIATLEAEVAKLARINCPH